jgi:hypothetical protein
VTDLTNCFLRTYVAMNFVVASLVSEPVRITEEGAQAPSTKSNFSDALHGSLTDWPAEGIDALDHELASACAEASPEQVTRIKESLRGYLSSLPAWNEMDQRRRALEAAVLGEAAASYIQSSESWSGSKEDVAGELNAARKTADGVLTDYFSHVPDLARERASAAFQQQLDISLGCVLLPEFCVPIGNEVHRNLLEQWRREVRDSNLFLALTQLKRAHDSGRLSDDQLSTSTENLARAHLRTYFRLRKQMGPAPAPEVIQAIKQYSTEIAQAQEDAIKTQRTEYQVRNTSATWLQGYKLGWVIADALELIRGEIPYVHPKIVETYSIREANAGHIFARESPQLLTLSPMFGDLFAPPVSSSEQLQIYVLKTFEAARAEVIWREPAWRSRGILAEVIGLTVVSNADGYDWFVPGEIERRVTRRNVATGDPDFAAKVTSRWRGSTDAGIASALSDRAALSSDASITVTRRDGEILEVSVKFVTPISFVVRDVAKVNYVLKSNQESYIPLEATFLSDAGETLLVVRWLQTRDSAEEVGWQRRIEAEIHRAALAANIDGLEVTLPISDPVLLSWRSETDGSWAIKMSTLQGLPLMEGTISPAQRSGPVMDGDALDPATSAYPYVGLPHDFYVLLKRYFALMLNDPPAGIDITTVLAKVEALLQYTETSGGNEEFVLPLQHLAMDCLWKVKDYDLWKKSALAHVRTVGELCDDSQYWREIQWAITDAYVLKDLEFEEALGREFAALTSRAYSPGCAFQLGRDLFGNRCYFEAIAAFNETETKAVDEDLKTLASLHMAAAMQAMPRFLEDTWHWPPEACGEYLERANAIIGETTAISDSDDPAVSALLAQIKGLEKPSR